MDSHPVRLAGGVRSNEHSSLSRMGVGRGLRSQDLHQAGNRCTSVCEESQGDSCKHCNPPLQGSTGCRVVAPNSSSCMTGSPRRHSSSSGRRGTGFSS